MVSFDILIIVAIEFYFKIQFLEAVLFPTKFNNDDFFVEAAFIEQPPQKDEIPLKRRLDVTFAPLIGQSDIVGNILSYLCKTPQDVCSYSLISKDWYLSSIDNHIWSDLFKRNISTRYPDYKLDTSCSNREHYKKIDIIKSNITSGDFKRDLVVENGEKPVLQMAFLPDTDRLVTLTDQDVKIWDMKSKECIKVVATSMGKGFHHFSIIENKLYFCEYDEDFAAYNFDGVADPQRLPVSFSRSPLHLFNNQWVTSDFYDQDTIFLTNVETEDQESINVEPAGDGHEVCSSVLKENLLVTGHYSGGIYLTNLNKKKSRCLNRQEVIEWRKIVTESDEDHFPKVHLLFDEKRNQLISLTEYDRRDPEHCLLRIWSLSVKKKPSEQKLDYFGESSLEIMEDQLLVSFNKRSSIIRVNLDTLKCYQGTSRESDPNISYLLPAPNLGIGKVLVATSDGKIELRDYSNR